MNSPRTTREALMAELLGDVDLLLKRVEALPAQLTHAESKVTATIKALDAAGDRFRFAVTAFTEEAKTDLSEHLDRATNRAALVASNTVDEQRAALQEAARLAFRSEASDKARDLAATLTAAVREFKRSTWSRLAEHGITALVTSAATVGLMYVTRLGS